MTADLALIDAKAGWSTLCRRAQHATCRTARARCACDCHGPDGQTPPTLTTSTTEAPAVPDPILAPVIPVSDPDPFSCDEPGCGRTFTRVQALGRHRTAMHAAPRAARSTPKKRRTPPNLKATTNGARAEVESDDDGYDPWALIVGHVQDDAPKTTAVILSTKHDAEQVAAMLAELGHQAFVFRLSEATRA